jgi:hypothetical protein
MLRPALIGKMLLLGLLVAAAAPAQSRSVRAQADAVRSGVASMERVELALQWAEGEDTGQLEIRVGQLDFPLLSYRARDLAWRCPLVRGEDGNWLCNGQVTVAGGRSHALSLAISSGSTRADLAVGGSRISYESQAASPDLSRVQVQEIPVAWLDAFLAGLWADGQWTEGTIGGRLDVIAPTAGALQVLADLQLAGLGLETPDGSLAAAGVTTHLALDYRQPGASQRVRAKFTTGGGALLAQGLYVELPTTPVAIEVSAEQDGEGPWRLPAFSWRDAGVLQVDGSAGLDAQAEVRDLDFELRLGDLAVARDRYLSGFLAPAGFGDLVLSGAGSARLQLAGGELQAMAMTLAGVTAVDPRQRFTLAGLQGDLRWTAGQAAVKSRLGWASGALYGIGLGAAVFDFGSVGGELRLAAPVAVDVLAGNVSLDDLRWQAPSGDKGTRFQLGATLDGLDLGSLSQRLGWPPFTGSLDGRIPSARYERGVLTLDGGLAMQLFGGSIALSELVMERPFGIAPTLSADIVIEDIDMAPMTAAFGFGTITGRLDGRIANLRMVDWSPVAFDARLQTDPDWKGRRRISQRAVEDISKVGGAGLVAGLQTQILKIFDDFGYARIGLACRLRDNVCAMDGVSSAGDGYTIVEGSGLPRIQVVGFRRQVDWPTLVDRLKAATEGQAPVIQ